MYPVDQLYEEMAFVAYHFNWSREDVWNMPHRERHRWCEEISDINRRLNEDATEDSGGTSLADLV